MFKAAHQKQSDVNGQQNCCIPATKAGLLLCTSANRHPLGELPGEKGAAFLQSQIRIPGMGFRAMKCTAPFPADSKGQLSFGSLTSSPPPMLPQFFSSFLCTSQAAISKTNDYKGSVWFQKRATTMGPAGLKRSKQGGLRWSSAPAPGHSLHPATSAPFWRPLEAGIPLQVNTYQLVSQSWCWLPGWALSPLPGMEIGILSQYLELGIS